MKFYICKDCNFRFKVLSDFTKRHRQAFCPNCGENINVEKATSRKHKQHKFWTTEELSLLDKVLSGEMKKHTAAMKLNRTLGSIRRKLDRVKEERGIC
jgi:uncharacterized Zn finger protein (UPF0148 family)